MPLPQRILAHTATPLTYEEGPGTEWVEGERGTAPEPVQGVPFACILFLPGPGGEQQGPARMRAVQEPTMLYNAVRDDNSPVELTDETELLVSAPELAAFTGGATVRWQVVGDPQPFGPPGRTIVGVQATLRQVRD
jgi:hypothetical protein